MNNLTVERNELKYYVSNIGYHAMLNRLQYVLKPDTYSVPRKGYFIRSLYFDSHDDECLYAKQSGLMYRKKYRMRIYDLDSDIVKFEIKNKFNNQIFKETAIISRDSAYKVMDGDYAELLKYDNPVLRKIFSEFSAKLYRPKVIIDYDRDAFMFDFFNVRITFDKNLRSNNSNLDLFSKDSFSVPVILEGKQILEIKYNQYLPDHIRLALQTESFERMAISKYTLGRRFFKIEKWEDN